jgi:uncharacterized membrane protein YgdD (TMEM256/DUF423 family)
MQKLFLIAAGLAGAAGVATAAAAAHSDASNLSASSTMFLAHAPAFLALGLTVQTARRPVDYAGLALMLGVLIFCGDLLARQYFGARLFPMAAPSGGLLMILGWLGVAVSGVISARR